MLLTGACAGIGRETALRFARLGDTAAWVSGPPSTVYASSTFAVDGLDTRVCALVRGTGPS